MRSVDRCAAKRYGRDLVGQDELARIARSNTMNSGKDEGNRSSKACELLTEFGRQTFISSKMSRIISY